MFRNVQFWQVLLLVAVILLVFGSRKLPDLSRSIAQSLKIFRSETKDMFSGDGDKSEKSANDTESSSDAGAGEETNQGARSITEGDPGARSDDVPHPPAPADTRSEPSPSDEHTSR